MFVVFEGLDGAGKTSLIQLLKGYLEKQGVKVCVTREPGGTPLADEIRSLLLKTDGESPVGRVELLLYEASRAQHVETKIRPALASGQWVLCDRFTASSVAFQHYARGVDRNQVDWLNNFAIADVKPHLNILLDLPLSEAERRMSGRGAAKDRLESEPSQFHQRVRDGYLQEAKNAPQEWLVLDALKTPAELEQLVLQNWRSRKWLA